MKDTKPEDVARKFILENFTLDLFEFIDVAEWVEEQDYEADLYEEDYQKVHDAVKVELDTMIRRYSGEEG